MPFTRGARFTNGLYLFAIQFCPRASVPTKSQPWSPLLCLSAFRHHVTAVIFVSAEEEMVGTNAGWVIAFVTDKKAVRYRTMSEDPRHAMGSKSFPFDSELPVAPSGK